MLLLSEILLILGLSLAAASAALAYRLSLQDKSFWPRDPRLIRAVVQMCNVVLLLGLPVFVWLRGWSILAWFALSLFTLTTLVVALAEKRREKLSSSALSAGLAGLALIITGSVVFVLS